MNKKVKKNFVAAGILYLLFTAGYFLNNILATAISMTANILLIAYMVYLVRYQYKLNREKSGELK